MHTVVSPRPIGCPKVILRIGKRLPNVLFLAKKTGKEMGGFLKHCAAFCSGFPTKWGGKIACFGTNEICYDVAYIRVLGNVSRKTTTVITSVQR